MNNTKVNITGVINTHAREYALYTIEGRAIPNMIDGFKPVQRFVMKSALDSASIKMKKVASIGSSVSDLGYHHGETSAQTAAVLMASEWRNNQPWLEGEGSFGSRMVQEAAAARYVFAKVHDNFHTIFKDVHLSPKHEDPEHIPPKFYVPIIPTVLLNGVRGIATGFACNILPHDIDWVTAATESVVRTGDVSDELKEQIKVKFPQFNGLVEVDGGKHTQYGVFTTKGLTVHITEIPSSYEHGDYVKLLDGLDQDNKIVSYEDLTSTSFEFKVKLRRGTDTSEKSLIKLLGLSESKPYNQNINVIDSEGKLRHYDDVYGLIRDFVDYRMSFLNLRIEDESKKSQKDLDLATAKIKFIEAVNDGTVVLRGLPKKELVKYIQDNITTDYVGELTRLQIDNFTKEEVALLNKQVDAARKLCDYWIKTTPKKEFIKDLRSLV